jgi:hypothetical protein
VENSALHFVNRRNVGKCNYSAFKTFRPFSIIIRRTNEAGELTGTFETADKFLLARVWNNDGALSGLPFQ